MDMILQDKDLKEIGPVSLDIDFEVGDISALNDFELITQSSLSAYAIYIPDTEWGGIIEYDEGTTDSESLTLKGWTWRGLLTRNTCHGPTTATSCTVCRYAADLLSPMMS